MPPSPKIAIDEATHGDALDAPSSRQSGTVATTKHHEALQLQLEATTQMLRRSAESRSRDESLQAVLAVCQESIRGDVSTIMAYDESQDTLIGVARSDEPYNPEGYYRLPLRESSLTGLAFRERRVVAIEDVVNDPRVSQRVRGYFDARSGIAAPLLIEGNAIGAILSMNQNQMRSYSEHDIELLGALAAQAARILHADLLLERRAVAEHRFERLLRHAPIAIILLDLDDRIIDCNQAASRLTGVESEDLPGLSFESLVAAEMRPMLRESLRALAENESAGFDSILLQPSKAPITVALDVSRFRHAQTTMTQVFIRNVSRERKLIADMTRLATYDPLTDLLNRRSFENAVEAAIDETRSAGTCHTLLYIDLDQFKVVNDSCGHLVGDQLLKQVAKVIRSQIRDADAGARLGGDEFGVLLSDCSEEDALQIAERIRMAILRLRFVWEERTFAIGASIGAASIHPSCARSTCGDLPSLMTAVDSACYVAKDHGRNRVHVYRPNDAALSRHRRELQWTQRLRAGLDDDRFFLVAQPIVEAATGRATMCELLLRLQEDDDEISFPASFLPAAERYGLMPELDRWVISHAFELIADGQRSGLDAYATCSINVSGQCLSERHLVPFVKDALLRSGADPKRICFEITETTAMRNVTEAARLIDQIRELGCQFALDDFGKGFSSYSYLKHLPVDYLKLDGDFVHNVHSDAIDRAMVEAIHNLGHLMGLKTIAEHIEDARTMDIVRAIGIDYVQGHHIAAAARVGVAAARDTGPSRRGSSPQK